MSARRGSFGVLMEAWDDQIFVMMDRQKNHDPDSTSPYLSIICNDFFMKRVKNDQAWSMFSPTECPELVRCDDAKFEEVYVQLENAGKAKRRLPARDVLMAMQESTTTRCISKSAFKGKIRNLCAEIVAHK